MTPQHQEEVSQSAGTDLLAIALEWIDILSNQIGPRPSGSEAEKSAIQQIESTLQAGGYSTTWQQFTFPATPAYFPYLSLAGFTFVLGMILPGKWQILLIGCPFILATLPEINFWLAGQLKQKINSQNLIGAPANVKIEELEYLLVAHIDSAHTVPKVTRILKPLFSNLMAILEVCTWLAALIGMISVTMPALSTNLQLTSHVFLLVVGLALIIIDCWQQLGGGQKVTSGANDNASGVGVCMAIASAVVHSSLAKPSVGFLFSGAEEAGLYGARAFVRQYSNFSGVVINLDMVGYGKYIGFVSRAGRLKPISTDAPMNRKIESISPSAHPVDYRYRAGDFVPFLKAGVRTVSLEATNTGGVPPTYHLLTDTANSIQPEILRELLWVVMRLIFPQRS
jgi:hypothetical protein